MRKMALIIILLSGSLAHLKAEGPRYRHKEPYTNLEFQNVYQDLRKIPTLSSTTLPSGSTQYINNSTTSQNATFNVSYATVTNIGVSSIFQGGVVVASYTATGEITQPIQPSFLVTNSAGATDVTGDGTSYTVSWGNEIYDQGSDISNSTFTAPVTGKYILIAHVFARGLTTSHNTSYISIVTTAREYRDTWINSAGSVITGIPLRVTAIADMTAGDTATVILNVSGATKVVDVDNDAKQNYFSGTLLN